MINPYCDTLDEFGNHIIKIHEKPKRSNGNASIKFATKPLKNIFNDRISRLIDIGKVECMRREQYQKRKKHERL